MTVLATYFASAPTDELKINALRVLTPGRETIQVCDGFVDQNLGVDGVLLPFQATSLAIALPSRNTTGQQVLSFGMAGVDGIAQRHVDISIEDDSIVTLEFREYLLSDKINPASRPLSMVLQGGQFEDGQIQLDGSYQDLLNRRWPQQLYTTLTAPGLAYMP